ncbi:MAG: hypothetical protein K2Q06_10165, partial [Parvularculaceae bacterium]|nr:hypothetical protein [Parvularculaceae bacterium]
LQVDGFGGSVANGVDHGGAGLADQAVSAALRYRSQAPLIDSLMKELGLSGGDLNGLAQAALAPSAEKAKN